MVGRLQLMLLVVDRLLVVQRLWLLNCCLGLRYVRLVVLVGLVLHDSVVVITPRRQHL
jgi:hypothetical protein